MRPKRIKPAHRVDFSLTPGERDLIIERTLIHAELEERLQAAQALGARPVVHLTLNDMDDPAGPVAAEANHCEEPRVRRALEDVEDRLAHIEARFTDEEEGRSPVIEAGEPFTAKQGQYLAFIYYYTKIHGTPRRFKDLKMDEFSDIWIEQCDAAREIRDAWGIRKALGYLVGERLLNYIRASDSDPSWAEKLPLFVAEVKRIFTAEELRGCFATTPRVGPAAHVATDGQYACDSVVHRYRRKIDQVRRGAGQ